MASGSQEAFIVHVGFDRPASSVGRRLATSGSSNSQKVACGSVSRSTMSSDGHVGRSITTVSCNHQPDPAYRRSPATSLAASSGK